MATTPRDLLNLADALAHEPEAEERRRCAVSRAFYACLLVARSRIQGWKEYQERLKQRRDDTYQNVILSIKRHRHPYDPLASDLRQLKDQRASADYDIDCDFGLARMKRWLTRAHGLYTQLDSLQ